MKYLVYVIRTYLMQMCVRIFIFDDFCKKKNRSCLKCASLWNKELWSDGMNEYSVVIGIASNEAHTSSNIGELDRYDDSAETLLIPNINISSTSDLVFDQKYGTRV